MEKVEIILLLQELQKKLNAAMASKTDLEERFKEKVPEKVRLELQYLEECINSIQHQMSLLQPRD